MQGRRLAKKVWRCPVTPVAVLLLIAGLLYLMIVQWWGAPIWLYLFIAVPLLLTPLQPPDPTDLILRLEKAFDMRLENDELKPERTLGELHARICQILQDEQKPVPFSSWHRVKRAVFKATGHPFCSIKPQITLKKALQDVEPSVL